MRARTREGFALLAVLWVLAGMAVLGTMLTLTARDAVGTATNRASLARAHWIAEGCAERARAAVDAAMAERADSSWALLDQLVGQSPLMEGCRASLIPAGITLDVNTADERRLRALLLAANVAVSSADSLVDAILDWRDSDDVPRAGGAERAWYAASSGDVPRNGFFVSRDELSRVRGFDAILLDTLLGVEPGRVLLDRAPMPVLATLPGFGAEALASVAGRRARGERWTSLQSFAAILGDGARETLMVHQQELASLVTTTPDAWSLTSVGEAGAPRVSATVELRLVRSGNRAAIIRRRCWP